jgi:hypothetical protein
MGGERDKAAYQRNMVCLCEGEMEREVEGEWKERQVNSVAREEERRQRVTRKSSCQPEGERSPSLNCGDQFLEFGSFGRGSPGLEIHPPGAAKPQTGFGFLFGRLM